MTLNRRPLVFVIDDERVIAKTLAIILKQNGFDALPFTRAHEALDYAQHSCPDLVISDVMMPGMLGTDLAVALKKTSSNIKVLLFYGQAATADLLAASKRAGYDFKVLAKPIHPTDLIAALERLKND